MVRRLHNPCHSTRSLFVFVLVATLSLLSTFAFGTPSDLNDPGIYLKPPTPELPAAGGIVIDPTFGTQILRVTDPTVQPDAVDVNSNPNHSMFNADGTLFYLRETTGARNWFLYQIDRATFTVTRIATLPHDDPDGQSLGKDGAKWHPTDPNLLLAHSSGDRKLWQIDVRSMQMTLVVDLAPALPGGGLSGPFDVDRKVAQYFTMTASSIPGGGADQYDNVAVWDRLTNTFTSINTQQRIGHTLHSSEMDGTGQYVLLGPPGLLFVWDWQADTIQQIQTQARGHFMMGNGVMVNHYEGDYVIRPANAPDQPTLLFSIPRKNGVLDSYEDRHGSRILADGRTFINHFVTVTHRADADADWRPMMDEIFEVQTQGTSAGSWKRLAHHRQILTVDDTFTDAPRANADPTGSFVLFKSNWDKTLSRSDVFLLKVPTDTVTLSLNKANFAVGDTLIITLSSQTVPNGDLYLAGQMPDGSVYVFDGTDWLFLFDGANLFPDALQPLRRNTTLINTGEVILQGTLTSALPSGTYIFFAFLVRTGTDPLDLDNWLSNLAQVPFTFTTSP